MSKTGYFNENGEKVYGLLAFFEVRCMVCAATIPDGTRMFGGYYFLTKKKVLELAHPTPRGTTVCFCSECGHDLLKDASNDK